MSKYEMTCSIPLTYPPKVNGNSDILISERMREINEEG